MIELTGERSACRGPVAAACGRASSDGSGEKKSSAEPQPPRDDGAFQQAATRVGQLSAMIFQEVLLRNISQRASWPRMQITAPIS